MEATPSNTEPERALVSPTAMGRGLAVLRIFFGVIFLANGLAKVTGERNFDIGWYRGFLIVRDEARNILDFEVNKRGETGTRVPFLKEIVNDFILPNWDVFQWVVTGTEVGVGLLLVLGIATRFGALIGLGMQLFLAAVYFSSGRWMFEQPHEYVPMFILAIVATGRYWGLDGVVVRQWPKLARWPF